MTASKLLISTQEAARRLGITPSGVSRIVARGGLKPITQLDGPTGAFVFSSHDVDVLAALRDGKQRAETEAQP